MSSHTAFLASASILHALTLLVWRAGSVHRFGHAVVAYLMIRIDNHFDHIVTKWMACVIQNYQSPGNDLAKRYRFLQDWRLGSAALPRQSAYSTGFRQQSRAESEEWCWLMTLHLYLKATSETSPTFVARFRISSDKSLGQYTWKGLVIAISQIALSLK